MNTQEKLDEAIRLLQEVVNELKGEPNIVVNNAARPVDPPPTEKPPHP